MERVNNRLLLLLSLLFRITGNHTADTLRIELRNTDEEVPCDLDVIEVSFVVLHLVFGEDRSGGEVQFCIGKAVLRRKIHKLASYAKPGILRG